MALFTGYFTTYFTRYFNTVLADTHDGAVDTLPKHPAIDAGYVPPYIRRRKASRAIERTAQAEIGGSAPAILAPADDEEALIALLADEQARIADFLEFARVI